MKKNNHNNELKSSTRTFLTTLLFCLGILIVAGEVEESAYAALVFVGKALVGVGLVAAAVALDHKWNLGSVEVKDIDIE